MQNSVGINLENQKLKNVIDFYMMANKLKYLNCYDQEQSIADHVYGTMILAVAFYSEYGRENHLGSILRKILLAEMKNASLEFFDSCLENFSKGKGYLLETASQFQLHRFYENL